MREIEKLRENYAKYLHGVETDWSDGCYLGGKDIDKMCEWLDLAYKIGEVDGLRNALETAKKITPPIC